MQDLILNTRCNLVKKIPQSHVVSWRESFKTGLCNRKAVGERESDDGTFAVSLVE